MKTKLSREIRSVGENWAFVKYCQLRPQWREERVTTYEEIIVLEGFGEDETFHGIFLMTIPVVNV